jgi:hypothetical protein
MSGRVRYESRRGLPGGVVRGIAGGATPQCGASCRQTAARDRGSRPPGHTRNPRGTGQTSGPARTPPGLVPALSDGPKDDVTTTGKGATAPTTSLHNRTTATAVAQFLEREPRVRRDRGGAHLAPQLDPFAVSLEST